MFEFIILMDWNVGVVCGVLLFLYISTLLFEKINIPKSDKVSIVILWNINHFIIYHASTIHNCIFFWNTLTIKESNNFWVWIRSTIDEKSMKLRDSYEIGIWMKHKSNKVFHYRLVNWTNYCVCVISRKDRFRKYIIIFNYKDIQDLKL